MRHKKLGIFFLVFCLSLMTFAGCGDNSSSTTAGGSAAAAASTQAVSVSYESDDCYFDWQNQNHATLNLNEGSQTITKSGIYELTGTLAEGSVIVEVDKTADNGTVYLVLNQADISSAKSAPIYVKEAQKVVLILEKNTTNTVYQGSDCVVNEEGEPGAAIFSKADLTIAGSGTLNVTSDYNDGISSKDDLKITDGTIAVKAKGDGVVGKDLLAVKTAKITVEAGKDGMRSTNETDAGKGNLVIEDGTFKVTAANDALQAYSMLQISGGTFNLISGGGYNGVIKTAADFDHGRPGDNTSASNQTTDTTDDSESQKGLKATGGILISGGSFNLSAYEDALNSGGDLKIENGTFTIKAGDDALHADQNVEISGGKITIENCNEAIEGTNITISGGKIKMTSADDGFNVNDSAGVLTLSGGTVYLNAQGDGLDSNGAIQMSGGTVYVDGPTQSGNGAIDYNTSFAIIGGTLVAAGNSGMAEAPDTSSTQLSFLMYYSTAQKAGTPIVIKDAAGNTLIYYAPAKDYSSVVVSSPALKSGETYTLYSGENKIVSFTLTDKITYLNESGITTNQSKGPGAGGGRPDSGRKPLNQELNQY